MAEPEVVAAAATDMETEASEANPSLKREREEGDDSAAGAEAEAAEETAAKKPKVEEESKDAEGDEGKGEVEDAKDAEGDEGKGEVEEAKDAEGDEGKGEPEVAKGEDGKPVKLGPKEFASSVDMFDFFFALLHSWTPQLEINKYEQMVLEDLLKKGHAEPSKKIGAGIEAFEIRNHPVWQSRCFFVRRVDESADDFSFRKCVDNILPLPEDLKIGNKSNGKKGGGHYKGGGGGGRGGRGGFRGGRGRGRRGN